MKKIEAKVILQSHSIATDRVVTTWWVQVPKWIEAQINKHRMLGICWESDRATPCKAVRKEVLTVPFVPNQFVKNGKGMESHTTFSPMVNTLLRALWASARYPACGLHWVFEKVGVHKQYTNRILTLWRWQRGVITATEVSNLFNLRYVQSDPQPECRDLVTQMYNTYMMAEAVDLLPGEWHIPFVTDSERDRLDLKTLLLCGVARSGRAGRKGAKGVQSDLALVDSTFLPKDGRPPHLTPFEHVLQATSDDSAPNGPYWGFKPYRQLIVNEQGYYPNLQKGKVGNG